MTTALQGYPLSKDYEKLYKLSKKQSVICIVDYYECRDICKTAYVEGEDWVEVRARGIGYIWAISLEEFIAQCQSVNLEWVTPCPERTVKERDEWCEDDGDVLWWAAPINEPPYVGSPLCSDWPDYPTHFTKLAVPPELCSGE